MLQKFVEGYFIHPVGFEVLVNHMDLDLKSGLWRRSGTTGSILTAWRSLWRSTRRGRSINQAAAAGA